MRVAVVYGYGAPTSGAGNGLDVLVKFYKFAMGYDVDVFSAGMWTPTIIKGDYDILVGHSYGVPAIIKYARDNPTQKIKQLVLIAGVPRYWCWPWGWLGNFTEWVIPPNVEKAVCYQTNSVPVSQVIKNPSASFTNVYMKDLPFHQHTTIVPAAVKLLTSKE